MSTVSRILDVKGLNGGYGSVQILYDIDLYVDCLLYTSDAADE